jgi:hypothetical protein
LNAGEKARRIKALGWFRRHHEPGLRLTTALSKTYRSYELNIQRHSDESRRPTGVNYLERTSWLSNIDYDTSAGTNIEVHDELPIEQRHRVKTELHGAVTSFQHTASHGGFAKFGKDQFGLISEHRELKASVEQRFSYIKTDRDRQRITR